MTTQTTSPILVTGGTGKTGSRIVARLTALGVPVRVGSRAAHPRFDWEDRSTWQSALAGVEKVYIAYQPDLAVPKALDDIKAFSALAVESGVKHIVILSGRGEAEAEACERVVQNSGAAWTVLRVSWFFQNFSESFLAPSVAEGAVYLPAGDVLEPFIDVDDIADAAVAALTDTERHAGQLYEMTGPRLMTFAQTMAELSEATGRTITYTTIPLDAFNAAMEADQTPPDALWLMNYLFTTVLDGRNAYLTDGVQRALGRPARDFADFARNLAGAQVSGD